MHFYFHKKERGMKVGWVYGTPSSIAHSISARPSDKIRSRQNSELTTPVYIAPPPAPNASPPYATNRSGLPEARISATENLLSRAYATPRPNKSASDNLTWLSPCPQEKAELTIHPRPRVSRASSQRWQTVVWPRTIVPRRVI